MICDFRFSVEDVGIEPTSSVLQTDAMTTSANPPMKKTSNPKNQISMASLFEIWNLVLEISSEYLVGDLNPPSPA